MADNVTFQTTVATPPNATVVRTKDRSGVETQLMGLDVNPGGSSERLMTSPDENLPTRLKDLDVSIRCLIAAISTSPCLDAFDRKQVFVGGGIVAINSMTGVTLPTVTTVSALTTVTNPVYQAQPGNSLPFLHFQLQSQVAWANCVRGRIA
jgi:hypothetical protein